MFPSFQDLSPIKNKNYLFLSKADPKELSSKINKLFENSTEYLNTDPHIIVGKQSFR